MVFFAGALISSLVGAILMLVIDFGGFYSYSGSFYGYIYAGFNTTTGILIIIMAILIIYCTIISFVGLRYPDKVPTPNILRSGFYSSAIVLIISIIGGVVFEVEMAEADYTSWWLDAGFYGAIIGSLLTAIFFYLALRQMDISLIPKAK